MTHVVTTYTLGGKHMKKQTKIFTAALATTVALSAVAVASPIDASAAEKAKLKDESKINKSHINDVLALVERGIISGHADGTFRPTDSIRRDHAAKMIAKILDLDTKNVKDPGFKDVPKTHPQYGEIAALKQAGIISGTTATTYGPNKFLTRGQMAKILTEAFKLTSNDQVKTPFTDIQKDYFKSYIEKAFYSNVAKGITATTYAPSKNVTRQQLASLIVRAEKVFPENYKEVKDNYITSVFTKLKTSDVGNKVVISTNVESNNISLEFKSAAVTKDDFLDVTDALFDSLQGAGSTVALSSAEINGVLYKDQTDLAAVINFASNVGKVLAIPTLTLENFDKLEGSAPIFKDATGKFEGNIYFNFKDGQRVPVKLTLVVPAS